MIRPLAGEIISRSLETAGAFCMGGGPWSWHPSRRLTARSSDLGRWPPGAGSYAFWSDALLNITPVQPQRYVRVVATHVCAVR